MLAIPVDDLRRTDHAAESNQLTPQGIVFGVAPLERKEDTRSTVDARKHHVRSRADDVGEQKVPLEARLPVRWPADNAVDVERVEDVKGADDERHVRRRLERLQLGGEAVTTRDVVRVVAGDDGPARLHEGAVGAGIRAQAGVVAEHHDPRIHPSVRFENCRGLVRRRIVHDQEFEVRERLAEDAVDRLAEKRLSVVYGHDHAELHCVSPSGSTRLSGCSCLAATYRAARSSPRDAAAWHRIEK